MEVRKRLLRYAHHAPATVMAYTVPGRPYPTHVPEAQADVLTDPTLTAPQQNRDACRIASAEASARPGHRMIGMGCHRGGKHHGACSWQDATQASRTGNPSQPSLAGQACRRLRCRRRYKVVTHRFMANRRPGSSVSSTAPETIDMRVRMPRSRALPLPSAALAQRPDGLWPLDRRP